MSPDQRMMRVLQAPAEQLAAIDRVLEGKVEQVTPGKTGPYLLPMGRAAGLLGVSRATLWRMIQAKRLSRVEVLPGSFRVRRDEVEEIAFGNGGGK